MMTQITTPEEFANYLLENATDRACSFMPRLAATLIQQRDQLFLDEIARLESVITGCVKQAISHPGGK